MYTFADAVNYGAVPFCHQTPRSQMSTSVFQFAKKQQDNNLCLINNNRNL